MFRWIKDTETDEFGVVTDKDTGLLIDFPVDEKEAYPIQVGVDNYKIGSGFILNLQVIVKNVSDYDKTVYGITFKGFPDYLIYQSYSADIGVYDKKNKRWLIGKLPSGVYSYLNLSFKFTKPLESFHIEYEIELV